MAVRIMLRYKTGGKVRTDAYTSSRTVGTGKSFFGIKRTEREPGHSSVVSILKNILNCVWSLPYDDVAWF